MKHKINKVKSCVLNFIKGRWFPLLVGATVALVVKAIMIYCGFSFTYAPEIQDDWTAISAVGTWVGVIAAFIACIVAIRVPSRIAKAQDRIALYDKRMECQKALYAIKDFIEYIENVEEEGNFSWGIQIKYWSTHDVFQYKFLHKIYSDTSIKTLFTTNCIDYDVFAVLSSKHLVPGVSREESKKTAEKLKSYVKCLFQEPSSLSKSIENGTYIKEKDEFLSTKDFFENTCKKLDELLDV